VGTADLLSVDFTDATHAWAVGGSYATGAVSFVTTDGGSNWATQTVGARGALYSVAFADLAHGWAVGMDTDHNALVVATTNGGSTWTTQTAGTTNMLLGVTFVDATHGWLVGAGGTIRSYAASPPAVHTTTKLKAPGSVKKGKTLKLTGTVAAQGKVTIYLYRLVGTKWKPAGTSSVTVRSGKFTYSFKPKYKGKWRFKAHYLGSGSSYLASWSSGYANTKVK
jgi:hypothetical protein